MSQTAYPGAFAPDSPIRRLPWILALALLLLALALLGLGRSLRSAAPHPTKPKPLQAQIYELPPAHGSLAQKPTHTTARPSPAHQHPAQQHPARQHPGPQMQDKGVSIPVSASHPANAQVAHPHTHATPRTQRPVKATPQPPRHLNLATLQSQIDAATRHITASLPQQHDPHTLIARYYIKSLLLKLQRIGDMNQPTNLTGMPVVKLVIGSDGELQMLTLLQSSGNHKLDQDAMQIAHESSPFAPFPPELKSQTNHITFICYMHFMGYKRLHTEY